MGWADVYLQGSDEDEQTKAQVEGRLQANGEREVDLGVDVDQPRATAATLGLMRIKTNRDFLKRDVSEANPWVLANTYGDNVGHDVSKRGCAETARKTANGGGTNVDGSNELNDDCIGALVIIAVVELGNNSVALVAEVGEGVLDVRNPPLRDNVGDGAGEDHGTGSEDSEDGRETHDEEV